MADIIHLLPDHIANQIAAGEVVQRPASVVKELLENAIDAGADNIKLLVKDAGKTSIQVIDNGSGMSMTDARMCFERHATSKISKAEDLFKLHTKGFRGEALASIAAVSHVELQTKRDEDEMGSRVSIEGSKFITQEPIAMPTGTSVHVKNIFFNIPARRNFLKSDNVETRHIINEFQRVALAHPKLTFFMYHNDKEVYHLSEANLKKRIVSIFGYKSNEKLVPVNEQTPLVNISGYVGKPEFAKKIRGEQFFFVNDRFVKSPYLEHAIRAAFEGLIAPKKHPSYFLYLKVPTESIDINIHPTKTEIKFENEKDLYAIIRATVKHSLGQYNVTPELDFKRNANLDIPYSYKNKVPQQEPPIKIDRSFNPFKDQKQASWESLYTGAENVDFLKPLEETELEQSQLISQEYIGFRTQQLHQKYLISSIKSGLVLIHQTRAHQRILYEHYLSELSDGEIVSQKLLLPIKLRFNKLDMELIKEMQSELENNGFLFEKIDKESLTIAAFPAYLSETVIPEFFQSFLAAQQEEIPGQHFSKTDVIAKILAKTNAISVGKSLTPKEQEELVDKLFSCKEPNYSPFGKKCLTTLTKEEIEKRL